MFHNKLRISGDLGPLPACGAAAAEEAEKCQTLVEPGDNVWHIMSANILYIMTYDYASAIPTHPKNY